jgi:hypothetical protein
MAPLNQLEQEINLTCLWYCDTEARDFSQRLGHADARSQRASPCTENTRRCKGSARHILVISALICVLPWTGQAPGNVCFVLFLYVFLFDTSILPLVLLSNALYYLKVCYFLSLTACLSFVQCGRRESPVQSVAVGLSCFSPLWVCRELLLLTGVGT